MGHKTLLFGSYVSPYSPFKGTVLFGSLDPFGKGPTKSQLCLTYWFLVGNTGMYHGLGFRVYVKRIIFRNLGFRVDVKGIIFPNLGFRVHIKGIIFPNLGFRVYIIGDFIP